MLHVHRAERADRLVAALADVLQEPLEDPFVPEIVSVHSRGIERWIAQELATRLGTGPRGEDGICANVEFPFPAKLIRTAVARGSGIDPERDPWLPERLTWPLLELVDDAVGDEMLGPLRLHLGGTEASPDPERLTRRVGVVRHVADLFDRYGVHRPEMVLAWQRGADVGADLAPLPDRHRWQPALWRAVRQRVDVPSFAERHAATLETLRDAPDVLGLPARLALFGLTALPATYLRVLEAIGAHRDVHLMLLHPSPRLWERVAERADGRSQQLWPREEDPTAGVPDNPLLHSWGRDSRELQLLAPMPAAMTRTVHHELDLPVTTSLLARIQADVRADVAPPGPPFGDAVDARPELAGDDRSIELHDCHGRLRQVEVVRDAVLHLLAQDDDLEPRDVIVLCPDIETFAPLVTAVFGADAVLEDEGDRDGPPALRVRLADRSLRRTNPVLEVVSLLLDLVDGRLPASAVLDLIGREPVRARFGLDDEAVELLTRWIDDLRIRWGLDAQHRARLGLPPIEENSWRAGLARLQLGIAMADEQLRTIEGIVPFDGVEGRSADLAGRLTELIRRLGTTLDRMRGERSIAAWRDAIVDAADALTSPGRDGEWQRRQLDRVLQELVDEASLGDVPSEVPLGLRELQGLLDERLEGRPTTTGHRTGDLTFSTLVPMRSVPHRVVCLLGLDDGVFPRQSVPDSDDLLQHAPRVGDRDPRSEDRQLLLDAVLAATDRLVIAYAGRDERTNEHRPPAVPVDELLDVIDRTVRTSDGRPAREHLTVRHPLQAHDPRNFAPDGLAPGRGPWSFDRDGLVAAEACRRSPREAAPFLEGPLSLPDTDVIELDDLVDFLQHPVRHFVREVLDVRLSSPEDERSDAIPSSLGGLEAWTVGDGLLGAWMAGDDLEAAARVARGRGLIPPGALGDDCLAEVREYVDRITRLCERIGVVPNARRGYDVEVALPDGRLLVGTVPDLVDLRVTTITYSRVAAKHRLAAWARLLALTAFEPHRGWEAVTVGRHQYKKSQNKLRPHAAVLDPLGSSPGEATEEATKGLMRLIELYDRGRREPLPLACKTSARAAENVRADKPAEDKLIYDWTTRDHAPFPNEDQDPYHVLVHGGVRSLEELLAEQCRDHVERSWCPRDDRRFVAHAWWLWQPLLDAERDCLG